MSYYLAPSLKKLRDEIDKKFPRRDRTSDGWVGDTSHAARPSDHNPDWSADGVVRALDIDVDDGDAARDLRTLVVSRLKKDPRTYYIISDGYIYSRTYDFAKRVYTGPNSHHTHVHVSIRKGKEYEDSTKAWLAPLPTVKLSTVRDQAENPTRATASTKRVQRALNAKIDAGLTVDGKFGRGTKRAYAEWERKVGGDGDGVPGLYSLKELGKNRFRVVK